MCGQFFEGPRPAGRGGLPTHPRPSSSNRFGAEGSAAAMYQAGSARPFVNELTEPLSTPLSAPAAQHLANAVFLSKYGNIERRLSELVLQRWIRTQRQQKLDSLSLTAQRSIM